MVASSYGYQLDKETGSISLGGKTLLNTDPKLYDMSRDEARAVEQFVVARAAGKDGFTAAFKWVENRTKERLDRAVAADAAARGAGAGANAGAGGGGIIPTRGVGAPRSPDTLGIRQ